ncbi:uncharacterized protein F5Z01DRAFT_637434 [Emericellopsis atlantica]|uniref:Uncharacterized protein n=1 Tax=Emericellopsis atlantica TaxID=2614577 RepID=A0A9P7ZKI3_9HYPO|nr:uncharacterized protein F5Z01DRAFT_637434 [Emericellopsis atlantica]KAG9253173.1 hypothetical protein F5Z01DRAFT_637434 [Emericellopsis atlantica]
MCHYIRGHTVQNGPKPIESRPLQLCTSVERLRHSHLWILCRVCPKRRMWPQQRTHQVELGARLHMQVTPNPSLDCLDQEFFLYISNSAFGEGFDYLTLHGALGVHTLLETGIFLRRIDDAIVLLASDPVPGADVLDDHDFEGRPSVLKPLPLSSPGIHELDMDAKGPSSPCSNPRVRCPPSIPLESLGVASVDAVCWDAK